MAELTQAERDAQVERELEVAELVMKAFDPNDPYDGHHGNDRSEK